LKNKILTPHCWPEQYQVQENKLLNFKNVISMGSF
jgi:hypothetical protein